MAWLHKLRDSKGHYPDRAAHSTAASPSNASDTALYVIFETLATYERISKAGGPSLPAMVTADYDGTKVPLGEIDAYSGPLGQPFRLHVARRSGHLASASGPERSDEHLNSCRSEATHGWSTL